MDRAVDKEGVGTYAQGNVTQKGQKLCHLQRQGWTRLSYGVQDVRQKNKYIYTHKGSLEKGTDDPICTQMNTENKSMDTKVGGVWVNWAIWIDIYTIDTMHKTNNENLVNRLGTPVNVPW